MRENPAKINGYVIQMRRLNVQNCEFYLYHPRDFRGSQLQTKSGKYQLLLSCQIVFTDYNKFTANTKHYVKGAVYNCDGYSRFAWLSYCYTSSMTRMRGEKAHRKKRS